jgi:hypothetical protein
MFLVTKQMVSVKYGLNQLLLENSLNLTQKQISQFLFAVQGIGIVFVGIFLAAYLGGLPTTNVLHIEPVFRIPLAVFGLLFLVLVLITLVLAALRRKN